MDARLGLLFLFVLATSQAGHGRNLVSSGWREFVYGFSEMQLNYQEPQIGIQALEEVHRNENVCKLCEEFTTKAVNYLKENKTKKEVIDSLHKSCLQVPVYSLECINLVDHYAPLFFAEVSLLQPKEFCQRVNLCEQMVAISQGTQKDSCAMCRRTIEEILIKLKDPDAQIEVVRRLLKWCDSVENYVQKCKKLVVEYGPLILANAEKFLETNDLCTIIHACDSPAVSGIQESSVTKLAMVTDP